jgi:hypothetical protein
MTFTAQQITQSFVNSANNSSIDDPLKLAVAVTLQLNVALQNVVTQQALLTQQKTSEMSNTTDAMSEINNAIGRLQDSADTDTTYVGQQQYGSTIPLVDGEAAAKVEYNKIIAAGVDPSSVGIISTYHSTSDGTNIPLTTYQVVISKVNASAAAKNIQIQLDKLGSLASTDQLYMSNFTGKYNTNTDQISSYIKANFDQTSGILRNIQVS